MMIPSSIQRGPVGRKNIPVPVLVAGVVVGLVILVCVWTLLTMGTPPALTDVQQDIPAQI